jgi:hypothetical protein
LSLSDAYSLSNGAQEEKPELEPTRNSRISDVKDRSSPASIEGQNTSTNINDEEGSGSRSSGHTHSINIWVKDSDGAGDPTPSAASYATDNNNIAKGADSSENRQDDGDLLLRSDRTRNSYHCKLSQVAGDGDQEPESENESSATLISATRRRMRTNCAESQDTISDRSTTFKNYAVPTSTLLKCEGRNVIDTVAESVSVGEAKGASRAICESDDHDLNLYSNDHDINKRSDITCKDTETQAKPGWSTDADTDTVFTLTHCEKVNDGLPLGSSKRAASANVTDNGNANGIPVATLSTEELCSLREEFEPHSFRYALLSIAIMRRERAKVCSSFSIPALLQDTLVVTKRKRNRNTV